MRKRAVNSGKHSDFCLFGLSTKIGNLVAPFEQDSGGPGYHGCGSIKGKREKFPKRKEKKRKGGIS